MKRYKAWVQAIVMPLPTIELVWLECSELSAALRPGQFVMGERSPRDQQDYLLKAWPVFDCTNTGLVVSLPAHSCGQLVVGDELSLLGPCGKAIDRSTSGRRVGLVCEGVSPCPLMGMISDIDAGHLIVHPPTEGQVFPSSFLPENVEYSVYAGASATHAFWQALEGLCLWADVLYAVGCDAFYARLANLVSHLRPTASSDWGRAWHLEFVHCGMKRCEGCAVVTAHGIRYECTDGPFLELGDFV